MRKKIWLKAIRLLCANFLLITALLGLIAGNTLAESSFPSKAITFVVPTMLNRILNLPDDVKNRYDLSSLRRMTVAAESFPAAAV